MHYTIRSGCLLYIFLSLKLLGTFFYCQNSWTI